MKMYDYTFVCIGTNKLVTDSFGPRVGQKLQSSFALEPKIQVFGTMKKPVHFRNAKILVNQLKKDKQVILIDSALAKKARIGESYIGLGRN